MKKIGAVFAAAAIMAASASDFAYTKASAEDNLKIYLDAGYGGENDITEVELKIANNSGISAYSIRVDFDPGVLEFVDAEQGDAISSGTFYPNGEYSEDCVRLVWSDSHNRTGDGTLAVLRFKTADGTAETKTALTVGRSMVSSDLSEAQFTTENAELKIAAYIKTGDVNIDGVVDVSDVVTLNMYLLEGMGEDVSYSIRANCEVSGDNIISSVDSTSLMSIVSMMTEVSS